MNPAILRTLEDWTTHQDYFWFLAVLTWGAFMGAEIRRKDDVVSGRGWLLALAGFQIAGAVIELVLIAQDMRVPYTKIDFAMGCAQAGGAAALVWGATTGTGRRWIWRTLLVVLLSGLAWARSPWPVEAGWGICLVQAVAVSGVLRRQPQAISPVVALLLVLGPMIATHGPWAHILNHGRRFTDWSHFAIPAATTAIVAGVILATAAWRRRLREVVPRGVAGEALRRDLRRGVVILLVWLTGGVLLAFWYGRGARREFEASLLRRVELSARVLDPHMIAEALGPELRIQSIRTQRYPHGATVDVATMPQSANEVYTVLREQMIELKQLNPDFRFFHLGVWREGHLVVLGAERRKPGNRYVTHIIDHQMTPKDRARLAAPASYVEGPIVTYRFGAVFEASVPLLHPASREFLGWLTATVDATRWAGSFVQARLQTMALVAAGVGLWTVAVAYRLRREARDAAERKAAAAAAADRMKSAFLAKVSHELRTPIQSVLGYSELLASASLSEPHRTWLGALRTHGDVMLRLVNDLIDLGALQSGAFQLERAPIKLRRVIDDCVAAVRPMAAGKGLDFEVKAETELPAWVLTDGVRLRQVLLNLLTNAVKFTPAGRVSLAMRKKEKSEIEFTISDTGPGIPTDQRSRLFQPFSRLDPAAAGGSGLGLALVQGICLAMAGSVRLEDSAAGATFVVRCALPECDPPPQTSVSESVAVAAPALDGVHVLVAEDNSLVRELLMAFLSNAGAEVAVASDGLRALALAREFPPDVLLLDIGLPGTDGISVAESLRRDGARMRIIGLSAHASAEDEARARAAGVDEFLIKPVSLSRLGTAIACNVREHDERHVDAMMDDDLHARLLAHFTRETPLVLADLRAACEASDWPRLRRAAHYLKNSADVLGLTELQAACDAIYRIPEQPVRENVRLLVESVEGAIPQHISF